MGSSDKAQAWFCTTGLASDVVIEVDDMAFHLHKFPLMSKSQKLHNMIREREQNPRTRGQEGGGGGGGGEVEEEIAEVEIPHISLPNFPGGSETFEAAAKFCYHVKIDLNAGNAPALRCAAEYLEMTEEFCQDNLINRIERFLAHSVLRSLKSSVKALKSCESLSPMAEELGIVQRCIDSIAARANTDASDASIFGWPMAGGGSGREGDADRDLRVSIRRKSATNDASGEGADHWIEELSALSLPIYKRVLAAMKERDLSSEIIEGSLISYAKRSIPGLSRSNRHLAPVRSTSELEQRELLETIITNLPPDKTLTGSKTNTTRFLFRLLRTINILRASEASRTALERKIASQLEQATLDDLLMPSYSYLVETLYDVDSVERILNYYLKDKAELAEEEETSSTAIVEAGRLPAAVGEGSDGMVRVGRLVDGYLAEIASDANLRPERFCGLAVALPDRARVYDDGLYRAVDLYLKAHPRISEEERDKVCSVMDCRKLTLEACTHAAQNERLPLRAVVQVLFFEQLQLRQAIAGTLLAANAAGPPPEEAQSGEGETWRTAIRENQVLRLDMDSMQSRVQELERECSDMRKAIEKVGRKGGTKGGTGPDRGSSVVGRRFGCKFGTKVCDSQERTVLEPRKSQAEHHTTNPNS